MRDGTKILIKDMTTSHLINTIRMLERNKANIRQNAINHAYSCAPTGETAEIDFYEYVNQLHCMSDDEYLKTYTAYESLRKELEQRI